MNLRPETDQFGGRFNVLLTEDRPRGEEEWIAQLPRLLKPQGVDAYVARTGREAIDLAGKMRIHAAVIDIATPFGGEPTGPAAPNGLWLLELIRRLPNRPAVVLLRRPAGGPRQAERILREALRLGAFSVLDAPVNLERLLTIFQRLIERRYQGQWPGDSPNPTPGPN